MIKLVNFARFKSHQYNIFNSSQIEIIELVTLKMIKIKNLADSPLNVISITRSNNSISTELLITQGKKNLRYNKKQKLDVVKSV